MCGLFLRLVKFQIIFGVLEIPDIFGVKDRCWAWPTYEKKLRVAPLSGTIKPVRIQFVLVYTNG